MTIDTHTLMHAEIKLINRLLAAHRVQAKTEWERIRVAKSSFIAYGLQLAPGETVRKVEAIDRELSNELTRQRMRMLRSYTGRAVVRLRDYPLAIEVPHPAPVPLSWESAGLRMGRHMALIGRSYDYGAVREEYIDLEKHYHTLVAAMSGGGKSTLMRMALLTLALNTSPADLRIMLIDLKNDDLTPFRSLPHVVGYAGDTETAAAAIAEVHRIKTERIETQTKPYRLLVVIDELAELGPDREALRQLGSILSTGRSLGINVWAGTQYPTAATIGNVVNASFTVRLVGMVDGKQAAHTASKRAGSGAELLQLPGDFLRVDGAELRRMKAYNIGQEETGRLVGEHVERYKRKIKAQKSSDRTGNLTGDRDSDEQSTTSTNNDCNLTGDDHRLFPLAEGRPLRTVEAQILRRMAEAGEFDFRGQLSLNRAVSFVYGVKNPDRFAWIKSALTGIEQEIDL